MSEFFGFLRHLVHVDQRKEVHLLTASFSSYKSCITKCNFCMCDSDKEPSSYRGGRVLDNSCAALKSLFDISFDDILCQNYESLASHVL